MNFKTKTTLLREESGQMLLFVLVVVLLLMMVLFAIIANVKVDIKEVQLQREYEKGYAVGEEELLKISSDGYSSWKTSIIASGNYCSLPANLPADLKPYCSAVEFEECCVVKNLGSDSNSVALVKRKRRSDIIGMTIEKDDVLEVDVLGATGTLNLNWSGSGVGMSIMLVCRRGSDYQGIRVVACKSGSCGGSGFTSIAGASSITVGPPEAPLNLSSGCNQLGAGWLPFVLRLRAINGVATNVQVSGGTGLPYQMEEIRVQTFPVGTAGDIEVGLPAPEVYTLSMINKRLPALFDYVLFVANGAVTKPSP